MHFLFYRISSCLFFGDPTDCFPSRRRTLLLLLKNPENSSNPHWHLICHSGFDSGVIFVTFYSFLMLILCDQLSILITTVHRCFLSKKTLPGYWPFCLCLAFSSFFFSRTLTCGMLRVIRTLNIFAQVILWSEKNYTIP